MKIYAQTESGYLKNNRRNEINMLKYSATLESAKEYAQERKLDTWIQLYEKVW